LQNDYIQQTFDCFARIKKLGLREKKRKRSQRLVRKESHHRVTEMTAAVGKLRRQAARRLVLMTIL